MSENDINTQRERLREFARVTGFATSSAGDYEACRCLFFNHVPLQGAIMGAYAVEKMLKAVLLLDDPRFKYRDKKVQHSIPLLGSLVTERSLIDLSEHYQFMDRLNIFFNIRYHDGKTNGGITFGPLDDLYAIDKIYIQLAHEIKLPPDIKVRSGLRSAVFRWHPPGVQNWFIPKNAPLRIVLEDWIQDLAGQGFAEYHEAAIAQIRNLII